MAAKYVITHSVLLQFCGVSALRKSEPWSDLDPLSKTTGSVQDNTDWVHELSMSNATTTTTTAANTSVGEEQVVVKPHGNSDYSTASSSDLSSSCSTNSDDNTAMEDENDSIADLLDFVSSDLIPKAAADHPSKSEKMRRQISGVRQQLVLQAKRKNASDYHFKKAVYDYFIAVCGMGSQSEISQELDGCKTVAAHRGLHDLQSRVDEFKKTLIKSGWNLAQKRKEIERISFEYEQHEARTLIPEARALFAIARERYQDKKPSLDNEISDATVDVKIQLLDIEDLRARDHEIQKLSRALQKCAADGYLEGQTFQGNTEASVKKWCADLRKEIDFLAAYNDEKLSQLMQDAKTLQNLFVDFAKFERTHEESIKEAQQTQNQKFQRELKLRSQRAQEQYKKLIRKETEIQSAIDARVAHLSQRASIDELKARLLQEKKKKNHHANLKKKKPRDLRSMLPRFSNLSRKRRPLGNTECSFDSTKKESLLG